MQNESEAKLSELEKALSEAINKAGEDEQSKYYKQAIASCPDLVERESNPLYFLRACQGDTQAAAQKLLLYWQTRVLLFGDEAFLPMEATGNAALTEQESSQILRAGIIQPLPQDAENCMVLLVRDEDREADAAFQPNNTEEGNMARNNRRLFFYWLQVCSEHAESQTKGLVLLHVQQGAPTRSIPGEVAAAATLHRSSNFFPSCNFKDIQRLIDQAFPIKLKAAHFCLVSHSPEDDMVFRQQVIPSLRQVMLGSSDLMIHFGSKKDILKALESNGMSKENLPPVVGGSWHLDSLAQSHGASNTCNEGASAANDTGQNNDAMDADDCDQDESSSTSSEEDRKPAAIITPKTSTPTDSDHEDRLSSEEKEQLQTQLEKALDEIPLFEKKELEQAKQRAPLLFTTECDPLKFLMVEQQESRRAVRAAARRLVSYWKHRIGLFGEKAFLPLNQTGMGALNEEDVALLQTGFVAPIFGDDRSITLCFRTLYHHRQKETPITPQAKLRCIFYVLAAVLQLNGASLPQCASTSTSSAPRSSTLCQLRLLLPNIRDRQLRRALSMIQECFPVQLNSIHVVVIAPGGATRVFQEVFLAEMKTFGSQGIKEKTVLHVASTKEEILSKLIGKGLSKDIIPEHFGGEWTYSRFDAWQQARLSFESGGMLNQQQAGTLLANLGALAEQALQDTETTTAASAATTSATTQIKEAHQVEIAMEQVPHDLKEAYLEAKRLVPHLVEKESNPTLFLRCEGNNALAAARRIANYWKSRKEIFLDKALLPLDQTGEGALCRGDMNLLSSGFMVLLPKLSTGHTVLCYDGSRLSKAPKDSQLRVAFYWFSVASENPKSQSDGIILLHLIDKLNTTVRDKRQPLDTVLQVLPIHIKLIHAVASTTVRSVTDRGIHGAVNKLFGPSYSGKVVPYGGALGNALVLHLKAHGLSIAGIPKSVGGSWGYEQFVQYIELRTRYEWDLPPGSGSKDMAKFFDFSGVRNLSDLTEEERTERRRRMNVLHSRRKRERERIEIEVLHEQCADLEHKNKRLFLDNSRLDDMLQTAQRKIARTGAQDRPTARRNYSLPSATRSASSASSRPQDYRRTPLGSESASSSAPDAAAASNQNPAVLDALLAQQLLLSSGQLGGFALQLQQQPQFLLLPGSDEASAWQELLLAQQHQQQHSLLERARGDPLRAMQLRHAMEERQLQELLFWQQQQHQHALLSSSGAGGGGTAAAADMGVLLNPLGVAAAAAALGGAATGRDAGDYAALLQPMLQAPQWLRGGLPATATAQLPVAVSAAAAAAAAATQHQRRLSDQHVEEDDDNVSNEDEEEYDEDSDE